MNKRQLVSFFVYMNIHGTVLELHLIHEGKNNVMSINRGIKHAIRLLY